MTVAPKASTKLQFQARQRGLQDNLRSAFAVMAKDARTELRAKQSLSAVLLFAVTSAVAVSFALGAWGSRSEISASLLWLIIYFSAMSGLSRSFTYEEEIGASAMLKLSVPPNSVYFGKLLFNLMVLIAIEVVAVPLFLLLSGASVDSWSWFIAVLLLASIGLSAGTTMSAAMVAKASSRGALFAVISFPLLVPVLALAIHGTVAAFDMRSGLGPASDVKLLAYYCGVVITASLMLFRFVWED